MDKDAKFCGTVAFVCAAVAVFLMSILMGTNHQGGLPQLLRMAMIIGVVVGGVGTLTFLFFRWAITHHKKNQEHPGAQ